MDSVKGGYKGAPKFPSFNLYETLIYFFNKTNNTKYIRPVETLLKQICSKGIYDHVDGGISRYTIDENWVVPHFEKMLYDNAQFILLVSKYCKINLSNYFKEKLEQTVEFMKNEFLNEEGLLGTAYDADSEGEEGKYYIFEFKDLKEISEIDKYFEISPKETGKIK